MRIRLVIATTKLTFEMIPPVIVMTTGIIDTTPPIIAMADAGGAQRLQVFEMIPDLLAMTARIIGMIGTIIAETRTIIARMKLVLR